MNSVNEQFAADKEAQRTRIENLLRDGQAVKFTKDGQEFYKIMSGWDAGEVFSAKTLEPRHGLDLKQNGDLAFYGRKPAWWALAGQAGTIIPAGLTSVDAVLEASGLNYTVELVPEQWTGIDGILRSSDKSFVSIRTDTNERLGTVGTVYKPFQNASAFGFLEDLFGSNEFICETAFPMDNGAKAVISAKLPEPLLVDPQGIADPIEQFVMISNSHDGKGKVKVVVTPWRPVCRNTERFALRDALTSWSARHTSKTGSKVKDAQTTLFNTAKYYQEWLKEEEALLTVSITTDEVMDLCDEIWTIASDASNRIKANHNGRKSKAEALFTVESMRAGKNAYAAERTITALLDDLEPLKPRNDLKGNALAALGRSIVLGTEDVRKSKAHALLMNRVK